MRVRDTQQKHQNGLENTTSHKPQAAGDFIDNVTGKKRGPARSLGSSAPGTDDSPQKGGKETNE